MSHRRDSKPLKRLKSEPPPPEATERDDEFKWALNRLASLARPMTQEDIDGVSARWGPNHFMTRSILKNRATGEAEDDDVQK